MKQIAHFNDIKKLLALKLAHHQQLLTETQQESITMDRLVI